MDKKTMLKAIKATINKNTVLPILEDVYLHDDKVTVTDLETIVTMPFNSGITTCIDHGKFLDAFDLFKEPEFKAEIKRWDSIKNDKKIENYSAKVTISEGKRKITLQGYNELDFPRNPIEKDKASYVPLGHFPESYNALIENALRFVSKDDLRPAMTGIFFDKEIVSTYAHRLYHHPIEPVAQSFILPAKTARILLVFGGEWDVTMYENHVCFQNANGVQVVARTIDARYPNYKVVIPEGNGAVRFFYDVSAMRKELKNALKFANKATNQVILNLNGKAEMSAGDADFKHEYVSEIEAEYQGEIRIAFNGKFMDEICSQLDGAIKIDMWTKTKAMIVNDHYLLMPLMLKDGE